MKKFFFKAKELVIETTCLVLLTITAYQLIAAKFH
jgi:hypothetical protein